MRRALAITVVCAVVAGCGGGDGSDGPTAVPVSTPTPHPAATSTATVTPAPAALAWAAGSNRLLRSDDGGFTWLPEPVLDVGDALEFVDRQVGWVTGSTGAGGRLLHTTDGGETWGEQALDLGTPPPFFFEIDAIDDDRAVIAGSENRLAASEPHRGPPALFFTDDAGATWRRSTLVGIDLTPLGDFVVLRVCLTEAGDGIAIVNDATNFTDSFVLLTHDAGATWRRPTAAPPAFYARVACVGEHDLWIAGNDGLFHSGDAGATWHDRSSGVPHSLPLIAIRFEDVMDGRVVGFTNHRLVLLHTRDGGEHWTSRELAASTGLIEPTVGMDFHGEDGVLVLQDSHPLQIPRSDFAVAFATHDGGTMWTETVFPEPINALWDVALFP